MTGLSVNLSARMIRAWKGAAVSVILLLLAEQRVLTQAEMRRGTGYGDEAINDAVYLLQEDGVIVRVGRYSWALLDNARQLPLPADEHQIAGRHEQMEDEITADYESQINLAPDDPELNPHACKDVKYIEINHEGNDPACMSSSGFSGAGREPAETALDQALREAGFREPGLSELRGMPGLTARVVRYHVETAPALGVALYRIRHMWRVPAGYMPDLGGSRREYIEGRFADFVEH